MSKRPCDVCGEPARFRVTYLVENARANPLSSAYGRDDCSWCSDAEAFACTAHKEELRRTVPPRMGWCSTFDGERFPRMLEAR
jgi:hypothetical protein